MTERGREENGSRWKGGRLETSSSEVVILYRRERRNYRDHNTSRIDQGRTVERWRKGC